MGGPGLSDLSRVCCAAVLVAVLSVLLPPVACGFDLSAGLNGGVGLPFYSGPGHRTWLADVGLTPNLGLRLGGGGFLTLGLVDFLALQPEIHFSMLGGVSGEMDYAIWKDKMPALDGQFLVKLRFHGRGFTLFELFVGAQAIVKLGETSFVLEDWSGYTTGTWVDSYIADLTFGAVAGLGWTFARGASLFSIDARFCRGLSSRMRSESGYDDWFQNNIQLMFGFGRQFSGRKLQAKPGRVR